MEASPLPFLNPEPDFSSFFNLFPEMSELGGGIDDVPFKRRRTEDVDDESGAKFSYDLKDALTSLFAVDVEQNSTPIDGDQNRAQVMSDFYSREVDSLARPAKRSRSATESGIKAQARRLWVKDRSKDWWEKVSRTDFPEEEFRKAFRMRRATFDRICDDLDAAVTKKNTTLRDAIPVRQRVAVCIWRLATGEPLRLVSRRFGLGISTCHKLVLEVCAAMRKVLMPKFIQWPDPGHLNMTKSGFESLSGIPNLGGSMYTTHIPIIAPKDEPQAYYNKRHTEKNQKPSYSITVQGVTDCRGIFTEVYIGWPGSFSDEKVLESSTLYKKAAAGHLSNLQIAASSGLPLTDWVLVPYSHQNLTWTQNLFNDKLDDVLKVSKEAFCRLKGRWACLQKRTEVKLTELPAVLAACCVLHNICEINGEEMSSDLRFEVLDDEVVLEKSVRSVGAVQVRDQIAHKLLHHGSENTFL